MTYTPFRGVRCIITGKTYTSMREAAEDHGLSRPTVLKSSRTGMPVASKTLGTFTWFVTPATPPLQPPVDNRTEGVVCVTTGQSYDSMTDAAADHGLHVSQLSRAIRTGKAVKGQIWCKAAGGQHGGH